MALDWTTRWAFVAVSQLPKGRRHQGYLLCTSSHAKVLCPLTNMFELVDPLCFGIQKGTPKRKAMKPELVVVLFVSPSNNPKHLQ